MPRFAAFRAFACLLLPSKLVLLPRCHTMLALEWQVLQRMLEEAARQYSQPDEVIEGIGAGMDAVSWLRSAEVELLAMSSMRIAGEPCI